MEASHNNNGRTIASHHCHKTITSLTATTAVTTTTKQQQQQTTLPETTPWKPPTITMVELLRRNIATKQTENS